MAEERKGFFTESQQKKLEKVIVFKNKLFELIDGVAINTIDNIVLEKIAEKLSPELKQTLYTVIDEIVEAIPDPV
jgi:hypothetical protein